MICQGVRFLGGYEFILEFTKWSGGTFIWVGTFLKNFFEWGGGTFIWVGTFIWHWIVGKYCRLSGNGSRDRPVAVS